MPTSAIAPLYLRPGDQGPAVVALKACLGRLGGLTPALPAGPAYDEATHAAVLRLQQAAGAKTDGVVGPATWAIVGARLRRTAAGVAGLALDGAPAWVRNLVRNDPARATPRTLDVPLALDLHDAMFGPLPPERREGLATLLRAIAADAAVTDLRWAAYMLATVKHECADHWLPIEEFGKGARYPYGKAVTVRDPATGRTYRNVYYGRGYVQLTWEGNYRNMGRGIGLGTALWLHPERALEPGVAYALMSLGMRKGMFTGKGLPDYIAGDRCDYVNARRIINGTDAAERIAGYAVRLEGLLAACVPAGAGAGVGVAAGATTVLPGAGVPPTSGPARPRV